MPIFPTKLKRGDTIAVIAPSNSLSIISKENRKFAVDTLANKFGLKAVFSHHALKCDSFKSTSVQSRVADLHKAFSSNKVKGILTAIGGYNANQLLQFIDYDLIRKHPKIFCGYSDITVLSGAILRKSNLVTYSGPHFSTFGMKKGIDYTIKYFEKCLMEAGSFVIEPSTKWSDDKWYIDQEKRTFYKNHGMVCVNTGKAEGLIIGGNLNTFNLLQGTEFMPHLEGAILFLEDTDATGDSTCYEFDRNLQTLIHLSEFAGVKGLVIGRFQKGANLKIAKLIKMIKNKKELRNIPVIANLDFGHTTPQMTFPVGGRVSMSADKHGSRLTILRH